MKTIIITGASNGIGRAIAQELEKDYRIINIDIDENYMENVEFYKCDLSMKEDLLKTIEKIKANVDLVYALINNAALFSHKSIDEQNIDEWEKILSVNLTAPYILSKEFSALLKESKGQIINISSTRALLLHRINT